MPSFEKSPAELAARFADVLAGFPDASPRPMFGYPAAFVGGNLITSLFADRWVVRLAPDDLRPLLEDPEAGAFEPMAGRPMRGYALLPRVVADDAAAARRWVAKAVEFGGTLPPK